MGWRTTRKEKMKFIFLTLIFLATSAAAKQKIDFEKLADAIKQHENSIKFPYGAEHRINGKLVGYPEPKARAICISICRKAFRNWNGKGDYFQCLNKIYAADCRWHIDVENKYNKLTKKEK
jgi:hypothetical protein